MKNVFSLLRESKKPFRIKATGNSMLPTIKPGDLLLIKPLQSYNQKITTNEIVVFIRDKHIICHCVLYNFHIRRLKYYLEKGDNNLFAWIIRSNKILGIVTEIRW